MDWNQGDTKIPILEVKFGADLGRAWGREGIFNMADARPWFYTIRKHRKKCIAAALFAGWLMNYGANKYR